MFLDLYFPLHAFFPFAEPPSSHLCPQHLSSLDDFTEQLAVRWLGAMGGDPCQKVTPFFGNTFSRGSTFFLCKSGWCEKHGISPWPEMSPKQKLVYGRWSVPKSNAFFFGNTFSRDLLFWEVLFFGEGTNTSRGGTIRGYYVLFCFNCFWIGH